jgi:AcrR family transcriptional regulator
MTKPPYHHGNLEAALVQAAADVLEESGVAGFSLRECARRAGVSHAAPAHHFGGSAGLLAAVAATGFRDLAPPDPARRSTDPADALLQFGLHYVESAVRRPARFQLMFGARAAAIASPALQAAGQAAHVALTEAVAAATRLSPEEALARGYVDLAWSSVHGFAHLAINPQAAAGADPAHRTRQLKQMLALLGVVWATAKPSTTPDKSQGQARRGTR